MAKTNPSNSKSRGAFGDEDETPVTPTGNSYFLGIGINAYEHFDRLNNAVKDVQDLARLLATKYGFAIDLEKDLLLDQSASRTAILRALRRFTEDQTIKPEDRLLIYYSGHGFREKITKAGFWIPFNAPKDEVEDFVHNDRVQQLIRHIPCRHILLVSDSCFSHSLLVRGKENGETSPEEWESLTSRWVFASGKGVVLDGKPGENSPFAKAILKTLEENKDALNIALLADKVIKRVKFGADQVAEALPLFQSGHDGGQFIFRLQADEAGDWKAAQATATPAAYEAFLKNHPGDGARQQAAKEALAYLVAKETRRWKDLMYFLDTYPDSPHKKEVRAWLKTVEQEEVWQKVNKKSIADLDDFIDEHPGSPFAEEARRLRSDLKVKRDEERQKKEAATEAERLEKARLEKERIEAEAKAEKIKRTAEEAERLETTRRQAEAERKMREQEAEEARRRASDPFHDSMVRIEGGIFNMGDEHGDLGNACLPVHEVSVKDFHLGKYPVTQAQWRAVMGENPSHFKGDETLPVESVSWDDVQVFLKKLKEKTGLNYRLPSEAEWEFAARGGKLSKKFKFSGSDNLDEVGWFWENSGDKRLSGNWDIDAITKNNCKTHPVGGKKANELGLHDMSGNVWEWCEDTWHGDYKGAPTDGSAWVDSQGARRVFRGGGCFIHRLLCRPSYRLNDSPGYRDSYLGFRLAFSLQGSGSPAGIS